MRKSILTHVAAVLLALLSGAALSQGKPEHVPLLQRADTNKDGLISRDEFLAWRAERYARLDSNQDGVLDENDARQRARERMERRGNIREEFDTDQDGKISKEEFINGPTPVFDQADTDGNGALDAKELEAFRAKTRAKMEEVKH